MNNALRVVYASMNLTEKDFEHVDAKTVRSHILWIITGTFFHLRLYRVKYYTGVYIDTSKFI